MAGLTSKKISSGLYEVSISSGRKFEVENEKTARGDGEGYGWNVFEVVGEIGNREYCQSYATKREAMSSLLSAENGEW